MYFVTVVNCVSLGLTITILISYFETYNPKRLITYFLICFGIDILTNLFFSNYYYTSPYIIILCMTYYMNKERKLYEECVLYCILTFLIAALQTYTIGSLFVWFSFQNFLKNNVTYNIFFACINILLSLFIRLYKQGTLLDIKFKSIKSVRRAALFCGIYFIFITRLLPLLISSKDIVSYSIVVSAYVILTVCIYIFIKKISQIEIKAHMLELEQKFNENEKEELNRIMELKHYYIELFCFYRDNLNSHNENDIETIQYFNYINEELEQEKKNINNLKFIGNNQIRHLFVQIIHKVALLPNVKLKIELSKSITIIGIKEIDLFKILSILFQNALSEVEHQENGFIDIFIQADNDCVVLKIVNSFETQNYKNNNYNFGVGLDILEKIISCYPNVDFESDLLSEIYVSLIAIQRK